MSHFPTLSLDDQLGRANRLYQQLIAIPDAFDPDTGRLNTSNFRTVMLYEMVVNAYDFTAKNCLCNDERTPNTDRSDSPNLD